MQQFIFELRGWVMGFVFNSVEDRDRVCDEIMKTFLLLEQDGSVQKGTFGGDPLLALIGVHSLSHDRREQYENTCADGKNVSQALDDETILKMATHHEYHRFSRDGCENLKRR